MNDEAATHEEIIIVRRGHHDHDEHHGGAWKVAFADFMTAMMAFFLVMWLINASNEETKKAVASYFNPVKLTDRVSNPRGLRTPKYGKVDEEDIEAIDDNTVVSESNSVAIKGDGVAETFDDQALFTDPYMLLSEISGGIVSSSETTKQSSENLGEGGISFGINGGDKFLDPFDPASWSMNYGVENKENKENEGRSAADSATTDETLLSSQSQDALEDTSPAVREHTPESTETDNSPVPKEIETLMAKISKIVENENDYEKSPSLQFVSDQNGTHITLFDKTKVGMFSVGSARPSPELVRIMAKIGKILANVKGNIIISGHTDGRKFKSKSYDNWRLSTARAHMAYHMLVRGGVQERRFEVIRGYGDHKLARNDDPLSPVNRRIEISIRSVP